jgi:hypothetical protein
LFVALLARWILNARRLEPKGQSSSPANPPVRSPAALLASACWRSPASLLTTAHVRKFHKRLNALPKLHALFVSVFLDDKSVQDQEVVVLSSLSGLSRIPEPVLLSGREFVSVKLRIYLPGLDPGFPLTPHVL